MPETEVVPGIKASWKHNEGLKQFEVIYHNLKLPD